jgi:glutamyl-tRNA reductase
MSETFKVATISYKNAPLALREKLVLDQEQSKGFYANLKENLGLKESIIISTCNRTEIYYRSEKTLTREIVKLLASEKNLSPNEILVYFEEIINEHNTIRYLFEVSIGVHSQIVGDQQIINQVKLAYQWATEADMAGAFLHKLMHAVFVTNKRVVQETGYRDGSASTTFVTLDVLESFVSLLKNPKVLVLGLGEIGSDIAKSLQESGYDNVSLCNRTDSKAFELAKKLNYDAFEFEKLNENLQNYTIIICSARANEPLIYSNEQFKAGSLTYIFDLSVPRCVSPLVDNSKGIVLYTLDEIQKRKNEGVLAREAALPSVKEIINQQVVELEKWLRELAVTPTIQKLKAAFDQIKKEELDRYGKSISDTEKDLIEKVSSSILQKILKQPAINLKDACLKGDPETYIATIHKLFDLKK